jgi:hypothetical protein
MQDDETKSEDGVKYTVFFDHGTFAELRERAAKHTAQSVPSFVISPTMP